MKTIQIIFVSLALIAVSASTIEAGILHDLIEKNKGNEIKELLLNKENSKLLEEIDEDERTGLFLACEKNFSDIAQTLIEAGANVNTPNDIKATPLHWACYHNNLEIMKALINKGALIDAQTKIFRRKNFRVLHFPNTLIFGSSPTRTPQEKKLYDFNCSTQLEGITPLHWACKADLFDIIKFLVLHGANQNLQNNCGDTALSVLVQQKNSSLKSVNFLIRHEPQINHQDLNNRTTLHWACNTENPDTKQDGRLEKIQALIKAGAELNTLDDDQETPLTIACKNNNLNTEIVKLLIQKGAVSTLKNYVQKTALDYINTWSKPEQRTKLFEALSQLKPNMDRIISAFVGFVREDLITKLQQNIVPPALENDPSYGPDVKNRKEIIELLHARMQLFFGQKKNIFPNHIPNDGLSDEMRQLDKQLFLETLEQIIREQYYIAHRDMSPRKVNTLKTLNQFANALITKYNDTKKGITNDKKTFPDYTKFRDIGICFE
ncbi:TPA: hypothetical protein DDZ86_05130 [Candidatus Dependentiae bacterium]|nr:MAG: hypothetical protein A2Y17_09935 [Clostridiales bacterium GWF2_38_85]HBL98995.1 hypothetical protein [Candidatus Dependentiae bacterium]